MDYFCQAPLDDHQVEKLVWNHGMYPPSHGVIQGALYPVFREGNEPQTGGTPPAPLLGTLAVPRMLLDVRNHPGIENVRAIVGGITAAIKLEIGPSEVQPDFFG
jgi:hypothetical protein